MLVVALVLEMELELGQEQVLGLEAVQDLVMWWRMALGLGIRILFDLV